MKKLERKLKKLRRRTDSMLEALDDEIDQHDDKIEALESRVAFLEKNALLADGVARPDYRTVWERILWSKGGWTTWTPHRRKMVWGDICQPVMPNTFNVPGDLPEGAMSA